MARLMGNVRIIRGDNILNGAEAIVNLRTNVARLVAAPGQRVQGIIIPGAGEAPPQTPAPAAPGGATR
jgi:lipopolysaccharide export system protein LptA